MAEYHFVTTWRLAAPIEQVWAAIVDYQSWPSWWASIASAKQIAPGDRNGTGEIADITFRTRLPYRVRFMITTTKMQPPFQLDGRAAGELEGEGRWRLTSENGGTTVQYYWDVRTTRWWMNLLAPVLRPAFEWNHDQVMAAGGRGLRRHLSGKTALDRPAAAVQPGG